MTDATQAAPGEGATQEEAVQDFSAAFAEASKARAPESERPSESESQRQPAEGERSAAAEAPAQQTQDIWKDAPDALRTSHEAAQRELTDLRHFKSSNAGREAARQRRILELEGEVKNLKGRAATAAQPVSQPDPELTKFETELSEVAAPVRKMIDQALGTKNSEIKQLRDQVAALSGRARTEDANAAAATAEVRVTEAIPDWRELLGTNQANLAPETREKNAREFAEWLSERPESVQQIAARNGDNLVDAGEAIELIRLYRAHKGLPAQPSSQRGDSTTTQPARETRREKQLESARTVQHRGPAPAGSGPDDFSQAFKAATQKIEQRRRA